MTKKTKPLTAQEKRQSLEASLAHAASDAVQMDPSRLLNYVRKKFPDMGISVLPEYESLTNVFHSLIQLHHGYNLLLITALDIIVDQNPNISNLDLQRELRRMNRMSHDIVRAQMKKNLAGQVNPEELDILLEPLAPMKKTQKAKRNLRTH